MPSSVICFDFDGTLIDRYGNIHPRDVEILSGDHDAVFILATGRALHSVSAVLAASGLYADGPLPLPLVLMNGGALYLPGESLLASRTFDPAVQAALLARLARFPAITFLLYTLDVVYATGFDNYTRELLNDWRLHTLPYDPTAAPPAFLKMLCLAASSAALEPFAESISDLPLAAHYAMPGVLEVYSHHVDKGRGVMTLLDALGLDPTCLIAAGDGENDLPLFEQACLSFCPRSAPAPIRAQADHVIDTQTNGLFAPILAVVEREAGMRS